MRTRGFGPTCHSAVVCNKGGHVHPSAINVQVSHAANEVLVGHREVLGKVGDTPQEQRARQVQGPGGQEPGSLVGLETESGCSRGPQEVGDRTKGRVVR